MRPKAAAGLLNFHHLHRVLALPDLARNLIVPMTNVLGPGSKDSIIMSHTCPGQYESPHGAAAVAFDPRCITYLFIDL